MRPVLGSVPKLRSPGTTVPWGGRAVHPWCCPLLGSLLPPWFLLLRGSYLDSAVTCFKSVTTQWLLIGFRVLHFLRICDVFFVDSFVFLNIDFKNV